MKPAFSLFAAFSLAIASAESLAKAPPSQGHIPPSAPRDRRATAAWPYVLAPWHHAATVQESWAIGNALWIEAVGVYDLYSSLAANNWESARHAAADNWAYRIRTWWQIRDERKARDRGEHPRRTYDEQLAITRMRDPKRLSPSQLSAAGEIHWPYILQSSDFAERRERLEALFAEQARGSDIADEFPREIDAAAIEMKQALDQTPGENPNMGRTAKNFLDSLRLEARLRWREARSGQLAAAGRH